MASRGQPLTIRYVAWDTSGNVGKTGDSGNHTLYWDRDDTEAAVTNSPSEVDATERPGVYKITLTAAECTCWLGTLCGKSGTADVSLMPLTVGFEQLPIAAPDAAGGLPISDAGGLDMDGLVTAIAAVSITVTPIVGTIAGRFSTTDIDLVQYEKVSYGPITITDSDGDAVDLSGVDLALVVYSLSADSKTEAWRWTTGDSELTVSGDDNNQITISDDATNTQSQGSWMWVLWDTTNDYPKQYGGVLSVLRCASPDVPA